MSFPPGHKIPVIPVILAVLAVLAVLTVSIQLHDGALNIQPLVRWEECDGDGLKATPQTSTWIRLSWLLS